MTLPADATTREAGSTAPGGFRRFIVERSRDSSLGLLAILLLLAVILSFVSPYFLTATNLLNIGRGIAIVGIVAVGETIVIIAGGFDLSVGSTMAAAGMAAAWLIGLGIPLPVAFAAAIAIGIAVGLANGAIISYGRINPLIATLATLAIVRGLSYVISGGRELVVSDPAFQAFGVGSVAGIPYIVILLVATFALFAWLMPRTRFGRYAYAIGSSAKAAQRAGVPVKQWRIAYYVTSGALAALAGLVFVARTGNAQPSAALGIELDVITAVILGGTSLSGGRGRIWGTFVGLLLLGVVNNGLILAGVPAFWQQVVKGVILLLAVLYDEIRRNRAEEA
ncbi:MAG: ABC transporter permease [Bauldia sp.]|nr:ABC transporter permease [Bauldia sp.]